MRANEPETYLLASRAAKRGGFKRGGGGASRPGLVLPFLSFFVLFGTFPICSGISRFVPFLFFGLLRAPTRNSPERVCDTLWTFPEKVGDPSVWKPPALASLNLQVVWTLHCEFSRVPTRDLLCYQVLAGVGCDLANTLGGTSAERSCLHKFSKTKCERKSSKNAPKRPRKTLSPVQLPKCFSTALFFSQFCICNFKHDFKHNLHSFFQNENPPRLF